jgi:hypothetical protein
MDFAALPQRNAPGDERLSWAAFIWVNTGIFLAAPKIFVDRDWLMFVGITMELPDLIAFIASHWRRVKPFDRAN